MRELHTPYAAHPLSAVDTHALFRCNEIGGSLLDATGGTALALTGTVGVTPGMVTSSAPGSNGARTFNGSSYASRVVAADNIALRAANVSVMMWANLTSLGTRRTLFSQQASGETFATNAQFQIDVSAAGELIWFWERSTGTDITGTTSGAGIVAGQKHHLAIVRSTAASGTADRVDVTAYVDGVVVGTWVDQELPNGGTSTALSVGGGAGLTGWLGSIDDLRISKFAAGEACVRDAYARGIRDWDVARCYANETRAVFLRALIGDGTGSWRDLSNLFGADHVLSLEHGFNTEDQVKTATLKLCRERHETSIAPEVASRANGATNVVGLNRKVRCEVAILPDGSTFADAAPFWETVFEGFVTDHDPASREFEVFLADKGSELQDHWIEPDRTGSPPVEFVYGDTDPSALPLEGELQKIVDDQEPAGGWRQGTIEVFAPAATGWNTLQWATTSDKSVLQEFEQDAGVIGWRCRYVWDDHRKTDRLTIYEPNRAKAWTSGDPEFRPGDIRSVRTMRTGSLDIRNAIEVAYGNSSGADALTEFSRDMVLVEDAASIAEHGRRYARVGLDSSSQLDDAVQATALANNMLSDLSQPATEFGIELGYRHFLETEDMARFLPNDLHFDAIQDLAIVDIRHRIAAEGRSTTVNCRGRVVGRRAGWFQLIQATGVTEVDGLNPPLTPTGVTVKGVANGVLVEWPWPGARLNRCYDATEVHVSTSNGFTPSAATLAAVVRGVGAVTLDLAAAQQRHIVVRHRDVFKNVSGNSAQVSTYPRYLNSVPNSGAHRDATAQSMAGTGVHALICDDKDWDTGAYNATTGRWTSPVAGRVHVDAAVIADFLGKTGEQARLYVYNDTAAANAARGAEVDSGSTDLAYCALSADVEVAAGDELAILVGHSDACDILGAALKADADTWVTFRLVDQD